MQNMLVHEYFHIDERMMRSTIQEDILPLRNACERIPKRVDNP